MNTYSYVGTDRAGARISGIISAHDPVAATDQLVANGTWPESVRRTAGVPRGLSRRRRRREAAVIVNALATLLGARLSLSRALSAAHLVVPPKSRSALMSFEAAIRKGQSVASALSTLGDLSAAHHGIITAGERAGDLAGAFARLDTQLSDEERLRSRLISAAMYPFVLVVAGGSTLLFLIVFVVPRFEALLSDAGAEVPAALSLLANIGKMLPTFLLTLILSAAAAVIFSRRNKVLHADLLQRFASALPAGLQIQRVIVSVNLMRLLSVLMRSGVPVDQAIVEAGGGSNSQRVRNMTNQLHQDVFSGSRLSVAMARHDLLDPLAVRLVALGEEAGQLTEYLDRAAQLLENRMHERLQRLVVSIEPAVVILMGAAIAMIAVTLFQAVYRLNSSAL